MEIASCMRLVSTALYSLRRSRRELKLLLHVILNRLLLDASYATRSVFVTPFVFFAEDIEGHWQGPKPPSILIIEKYSSDYEAREPK